MIVKYQTIKDVIDKKHGYTRSYIEEHCLEIIEIINNVARQLLTLPVGVEVKYNENLITQVIIDAIEDLKRIHGFHPTKKANAIKEAAYIGYWWVRRKPAYIVGDISKINLEGYSPEQIKKIKAKFLFINELCVAHYMRPKVFALNSIVDAHCVTEQNKNDWKKARNNLIYFLAYRVNSPKSLEAILTCETLHPIWSTKQNFWNISDE